MAKWRWVGKQGAVAQVDRLTVGGTITTETFKLAISQSAVEVTAVGGDTNITVATKLVTAWNDSAIPETNVAAATDNGDGTFDLTSTRPGRSFIATPSVAGPATFTSVNLTANAGPNVWGQPENYEDENGAVGVPTANDDLTISGNVPDILEALDSVAAKLTNVFIDQSYERKQIGLPVRDDEFQYQEYQPRFLVLAADRIIIGRGNGSGPRFVNYDLKDQAGTVITMYQSGGRVSGQQDTDLRNMQFQRPGSETQLDIRGGEMDINRLLGMTGSLGDISISGGNVRIWEGTTISKSVGEPTIRVGNTAVLSIEVNTSGTLEGQGGTVNVLEVGGFQKIHHLGPIVTNYLSSNPIGEFMTTDPGASLDLTNNIHTFVSITNTFASAGEIVDPNGIITYVNAVQPVISATQRAKRLTFRS